MIRALAVAALSAAPSPAWACTLCHSRLADDVRAVVFGADMWINLAALFAPVPVLALGVVLARRAVP
jgi:hypothetical protein